MLGAPAWIGTDERLKLVGDLVAKQVGLRERFRATGAVTLRCFRRRRTICGDAFHNAPHFGDALWPTWLVAAGFGFSHAGLTVSRHALAHGVSWLVEASAISFAGSHPEVMTGRGCLLGNPGPLAGARPLAGAGATSRPPRVAVRHPRSAILGPVRVSGSPLPCRSTRTGSTWGRLIRQSRPSQRTTFLRHARRRSDARASWISVPNRTSFQAPAAATSGVGAQTSRREQQRGHDSHSSERRG